MLSQSEILSAEAATELEKWFDRMLQLLEDSLFATALDDAHRNALFSDVVGRNARELCSSNIDQEGVLYTPTCLVLATLSRWLDFKIRREHWKAAIESATQLYSRLGEQEHEAELGLDLGTAASVFKGLTCEALRNAGLLGESTVLDEQNRKFALGVALNWSLRFLLSYALEATETSRGASDCQDLSWIRERIASTLNRGAKR